MKLILQNGYPFPYPSGLSEAAQVELASEAIVNTLEIEGVASFQWLHTLTIEFRGDAPDAQKDLGWKPWLGMRDVWEVPTSGVDGYDHPSIIARGMAYCGFVLIAD